jgi:hypothetical protein
MGALKMRCECVGAPIIPGFTGRKCKINGMNCWNYAKPDAVEKCNVRETEA